MPRYVILEHDHPRLHWDLMLEAGEALRTWRLWDQPVPGRTIRAKAIGDHRRMYLDYEGPVSGNRGTVQRWDAGTFTWEEDVPGRVAVRFQGQRCRGTVVLQRIEAGDWQMTYIV